MENTLAPLHAVLRLNTRLFENCLSGVDDDLLARRTEGGANSMGFIALHVADARYHLLSLLGGLLENPFGRFASARCEADIERLPGRDELCAAWRVVSAVIEEQWEHLTEAEWSRPSGQRLPLDDATRAGAAAFFLQHEAYHIGQMALLRRQAGLEAMRYD